MSRYYKKSAPFGKGEKRKEFVDAFILEGLSKCTHTKGRKIYVVSTDTDMEKYCESDDNLMHLSNLQDLLKLFFAQYQPAESYVQALIDKSYPKVSSLIQNEFPTFQFDTKEYSGEVEDVSVKSVTVLHHFTIFSTPETIDVVYVVKVEYSATITYESYEFACWDSEDHEWVGIERGEVEIDETHEMDVEVQLEIDVNTHRLFQINLLNFPNNEVIVIKFNPDDYGG